MSTCQSQPPMPSHGSGPDPSIRFGPGHKGYLSLVTPSPLAALRSVPDVVRTDRDGTVRLRVAGASMRLERTG